MYSIILLDLLMLYSINFKNESIWIIGFNNNNNKIYIGVYVINYCFNSFRIQTIAIDILICITCIVYVSKNKTHSFK